MKKTLLPIIAFWFLLAGCNNNQQINYSSSSVSSKTNINNSTLNSGNKIITGDVMTKVKPEKIEIVLFHSTQRCYSCNKMEELIKDTLEQNFKKQLDEDKISFKEINGELPENSEIVNKYMATGLSLFINGIINGKDNIAEETKAWRLLDSDDKFKQYLTDKLNNL